MTLPTPRVRGWAAALLLLVLAPGVPTPAPAQAPPDPLTGFDAYVERAREEWNVPGVAVAVVKDDAVVYARGFGVLEAGRPERIDEHTVFAIGSSSKAFTATAVAMLVESGEVRWDAPVTTYLEGFQLHDPWVTREITVRDLLTHRSGLARGEFMWYASGFDREEVLRRVRFQEPATSFRSRFGYQNVMYLAAGQVIPAVTGTSWDGFVEERILDPLGMDRSSVSVTGLEGLPNVASPHTLADGEPLAIPYRNIDNVGPAGSINASVRDVAQWVRLNLAEGMYEGTELLSPTTIAELHSPQTIGSAGGTSGPPAHFRSYGMGWMLQDYHGRKLVHHGGNIDGMTAMVAMIPEEELGLVVLANMNASGLPSALKFRILDAFLGVEARDWSAEMKARSDSLSAVAETRRGELEASRIEGTLPSLPLEEYAGTFTDPMYGEVTVSLEPEGLVLRRGPHYTGDLEHWHHDIFRATWRSPGLAAIVGEVFVTFRLDARGRVPEVEVEHMTTFRRARDRSPEGAGGAGSRR